MKKVPVKSGFSAIVIAFILAASLQFKVMANEEKRAIPVELKFMGKVEDQPVFQLSFSNSEVKEYRVVIRDEFNNVLYRENIRGGKMSKTFVLNIADLGYINIRFEITGDKEEKAVAYHIKEEARLVEDLVISKVK